MPTSRLTLAFWVAAVGVFLAACGAPGVAPSDGGHDLAVDEPARPDSSPADAGDSGGEPIVDGPIDHDDSHADSATVDDPTDADGLPIDSSGTAPKDAGSDGPDLPDLPAEQPAGDDLSPPPPTPSADPTPRQCSQLSYAAAHAPGYQISPAAISAANAMLSSMNLSDKVAQMHGGRSLIAESRLDNPDVTALRLKGFRFRYGTRGVNLDEDKIADGFSTAFPVALARAASFDLDLEGRIGAAMGDETLASDRTALLAPSADVLRHPFWGRAQETYGEDPLLVGRMASAFIAGVQRYVPACVGHFAAMNSQRSLLEQADEQTLREIYTRPFGMAVQDAGAACVIAAFQRINGVSSAQNPHLLTDILRSEWNFQGFVISDTFALNADTSKGVNALNAGVDVEFPFDDQYSQLPALVTAGSVRVAQISEAARRIVTQKFRFGVARTVGPLGLKPPTTTYVKGRIGNDQSHLALAQEAAEKSAVLLKNDGVLPLDLAKVQPKTIAVIGTKVSYPDFPQSRTLNFATDVHTGDRGSNRINTDPAKTVNLIDGLQARVGPGIAVVAGNTLDAAAAADFVVVVAGMTPHDEGQVTSGGGGDRATFSLNGKNASGQNELIAAVAAMGKPTVVVLEAGGAVETQEWFDKVNAVVMAFYPGQRMGDALARLLLGQTNFSGKLPFTWDTTVTNWPDFPTANSTPVMLEYEVGYSRFDRDGKTPRFPFASGLGYTTFAYSNLQIACLDANALDKTGVVNVYVDVQNTGAVAGDEVVFLFVSYPSSSIRRHKKELKGFTRVSLDPSEKKGVIIPLRVADLSAWDPGSQTWQIESGPVLVRVAGNSTDAALNQNQATFTIK